MRNLAGTSAFSIPVLVTGQTMAVTGHRPSKVGGHHRQNPMIVPIKQRLRYELERWRPKELISGMALGFDTWSAVVALELGIPLIAAVPCDGQHLMWPDPADVRLYQLILERAALVHVVSPGPYRKKKMEARNEWMVDRCQILLALWDGTDGGTANCVHYAEKVGRPYTRIHPMRLNDYDV